MSSADPAKSPFDLKSTAWTLTALRLQSADTAAVCAALDARFGDSPGLFDQDPMVIDLSPLRDDDAVVDFQALVAKLREHNLVPVAVQGGSPTQTAAAVDAGLTEAMDAAPQATPEPVVQEVIREVEVIQEVTKEVAVPTLVVDKPLRSGQRVYARGGDLVVLAAVNFGAEVIADGHVHVYAPLRGRAIAGARGNTDARIFTTCLDPQLVAIAGIYRTAEHELPAEVAGKPAQVRLDGERIVLEPIAEQRITP